MYASAVSFFFFLQDDNRIIRVSLIALLANILKPMRESLKSYILGICATNWDQRIVLYRNLFETMKYRLNKIMERIR